MTHPPILRHMVTVADPTRCRMLRILARQELTVSELCSVLQLPQSTVSRHLKTLLDDGWIASRRDGTSRFYHMSPPDLAREARGLWSLLQEQLRESPAALQDDQRVEEVLITRRSRSREFFSSTAGQWDRLRDELFGPHFHLRALPALLEPEWEVGDLGCGTGQVAKALAPYVRRVVAVDGSAEMLETAGECLRGTENVELRRGELEALPLPARSLDVALLFLVLHYVPDPARVLTEVARVLRPGGRLLIVDMLPHDREEYQQQMGHVWLGFSETQVARYLSLAGLEGSRIRPLPPDQGARGPNLFVATARRPGATALADAGPGTGVHDKEPLGPAATAAGRAARSEV